MECVCRLVTLTLQSLQFAVASEEFGVSTSLFVRTIVGGKEDDGVLVKPLLAKLVEDLAHILVKTGYHGSKMGMGVGYRVVTRVFPTAPCFVVKELFLVALQKRVVRLCELGVWQGVGQETNKGLRGILTVEPLQRLVVYYMCRVLLSLEILFAKHGVLYVLLQDLAHHGCVAQRLAEAV